MTGFIQSRRERFLRALTEGQGSEHQNSFRLDEGTIQQIREGNPASPTEDSAATIRKTVRAKATARVHFTPATEGQGDTYLDAIFHNPLDDYLLPRYHIQLSIVNIAGDAAAQEEASEGTAPTQSELRRGADTEEPSAGSSVGSDLTYTKLVNKPFTIIAFTGQTRTGENGQVAPDNALPTLFGVSQFNLKNYNSPSQQNPHISTYAEASMTVLEPYTFSFDKVLNELASSHGYNEMPSSRVIFRVDIWFSGWSEEGTYEDSIPISNPFNTRGGSRDAEVFTTFMNLIRVNAKINLSNSELALNFVPVQFISLGAAAEYLTIPGEHIDLSEHRTLGEALEQLKTTLNEHAGKWRVMDVTETGQPDESSAIDIQKYLYDYECHPDLLEQEIFPDRAPDDDIVQAVYNGDNIVAVIMNLVRSTRMAREGIAPDRYPRLLFTVRVITDLGEQSESPERSFLGDLTQIKVKFLIEPFYDFRFVPNNRAQALDDKGVRLAALISSMAIRRVYWFDHYGLNTEVIRFDQDLNNFYFKNIIDVDFNVSIGEERSSEANDQMGAGSVPQPQAQLNSSGGLSSSQTARVANALNIQRRPSINSLRRGRLGALGATPSDTLNGNDGTMTRGNRAAALYENEFNNLVQTDLIQLDNMEVRGDPRWLFNASTRDWNGFEETSVLPEGEARSDVIMVNVMSPKAQQYMAKEGLTVALASAENRSYDLTGFYQIVSVENQFNGGLFTQKFMGTRLIIDPVDASVAAAEREGLAQDQEGLKQLQEEQRQERDRSAAVAAGNRRDLGYSTIEDGGRLVVRAPNGAPLPRG